MPDEAPWRALRVSTGLSAAEVERRLGWGTGYLSLIERGLRVKPEREEALRRFYAELLLATPKEGSGAQAQ